MKVLKKIKKILIGIATFMISMPIKVMAANVSELYRVDGIQSMYGIPEPSFAENAYNYGRKIALPIIMVIGIIIYLRKSKSKKTKKASTVAVIIFIFVILANILKLFGEVMF